MKRRQSKLDQYEAELTEWLGPQRMTLQAAKDQLKARHGLTVGLGTLSRWWENREQERLQERLLANIASGARLNREIDAAFSKNGAPSIGTLISLLKTLVMQLSVRGASDPALLDLVPRLLGPVMESLRLAERKEDRELERRRLEEQSKSAREKGIAALAEEIRGNERAEKLWAELLAVLGGKPGGKA